MSPRILMVDDEPRVLDALRRTLAGRYDITVAESGALGLDKQREAARSGRPFAVIVSDMMMPGMNGAAFLTAARGQDPDVVALVLSGQADLDSTIDAVNEAGLFGFLTKPCPPQTLTAALDRAIAQYDLVMSERGLLERTIRGSVDMLTELMASANPLVFSRTTRVKNLTSAIVGPLGLDREWQLPLAARLSQLGCLAVPGEVLERAYRAMDLTAEHRALFNGHPAAGRALLERIPRLEHVAAWVGSQPLTPEDPPPPGAGRAQLALYAVIATVVAHEVDDPEAARVRVRRTGYYPPELLTVINQVPLVLTRNAGTPREVAVESLREGMELDQDVVTTTGMALMRKGEPITESLAIRLANFARTVGIVEPIQVIDYRYTGL
ncbi:MAG: response regulator [Kineosporiaceae bacterium]|nr:response regulator [Kineosporiaceae bacterium]